jgi:hypothetical protein
VNKQRLHRFHVKRFNLKKLNEIEEKVKRSIVLKYQISLEDAEAEMDINSA